MAGILAKIGLAVKKGAGTTGNVLLLVPKALIYAIKKPFASLGKMKRDATVSLKESFGVDVSEKEKKYDPPIEITEASKNLGVETRCDDEKVKFLASRTLMGNVPYSTPEQLGRIKELNLSKENKYSSIALFRGENKVVIEVDVEAIVDRIEGASEKEKGPEKIKKLVLKGIYVEVDRSLKELAKIAGGEFKVHTDRKLLLGVVERLYVEYVGHLSEAASKESLNTAKPSEFTSEITAEGNMTNPLLAYYQEVTDGKISGVKFSSKEQQDILGKLGSGLSETGGAFNKPKEPLFTPIVEGNAEREKGGRS